MYQLKAKELRMVPGDNLNLIATVALIRSQDNTELSSLVAETHLHYFQVFQYVILKMDGNIKTYF